MHNRRNRYAPVQVRIRAELEGNPETPAGSGRICAKGTAQLMTLYDRHRINYPVKRTNPEKGVGVDPKWERISWEEALETIVSKLKNMKDPPGCYFQATTKRHAIDSSNERFPYFKSSHWSGW